MRLSTETTYQDLEIECKLLADHFTGGMVMTALAEWMMYYWRDIQGSDGAVSSPMRIEWLLRVRDRSTLTLPFFLSSEFLFCVDHS